MFVDEPVQDPGCCVALFPGRVEVRAQHGIDRGLVRIKLRRRPSRGLSGWWFSTVEGLADGAAVDVVAFGESSDRESFDAGVAADGGEEFHS